MVRPVDGAHVSGRRPFPEPSFEGLERIGSARSHHLDPPVGQIHGVSVEAEGPGAAAGRRTEGDPLDQAGHEETSRFAAQGVVSPASSRSGPPPSMKAMIASPVTGPTKVRAIRPAGSTRTVVGSTRGTPKAAGGANTSTRAMG